MSQRASERESARKWLRDSVRELVCERGIEEERWCVCVCVREREIEREGERQRER